MKRWHLMAAGIGIAFLATKTNQLNLFASNLQYYIKNFSVPKIRSGFLHFPIKVQFENHSPLSFKIDRILTTISYWDGNGWSTLGSSMPTSEGYSIPANKIVTHIIEPRVSINTAAMAFGFDILTNLFSLGSWISKQSWQIHTRVFKAGKMVVEDKQVFGPKADDLSGLSINPNGIIEKQKFLL